MQCNSLILPGDWNYPVLHFHCFSIIEDDLSGDDDQLSQDNEIFDMDIGAIKIRFFQLPTWSVFNGIAVYNSP